MVTAWLFALLLAGADGEQGRPGASAVAAPESAPVPAPAPRDKSVQAKPVQGNSVPGNALPGPAAASQPASPAPPLAGGGGALVGAFAPVAPRAPELRGAVRTAVAHLTPARHPRATVLSAERQVVAGTNYRLLLKLRDGSRWRVVVWQRLDGTRQVTEAVREDR